MFTTDFWFGFSVGICVMFFVIAFVTVWLIVQAASFHDSWLDRKDKK
jgi:hypothetical protein